MHKWRFYWLMPYPNSMDLWPQFRSPLLWDVFAVSTYFTISLIFWYLGMVPDLATTGDVRVVNIGARNLGFHGSYPDSVYRNVTVNFTAGSATRRSSRSDP